jgi:hypothetical protein
MDRPALRPSLLLSLLARSLLLGMFIAITVDAEAQTSGQGGSTTSQLGAGAAPAGADRRGANPALAPAAAPAAQPRNAPSEAYRESIRRTVEKRRERRANRGQEMGDSRPIGGIVPWPMPPALIIRHTPQVHDEIDSFLSLLRK